MFSNHRMNSRDKFNESIISHYTYKSSKKQKNLPTISNHLKEIFSSIHSIELEDNKLHQELIVIGDEGSGKSSLIEYLLNIDIFPKTLPNSKAALKFTVESMENFENPFLDSKTNLYELQTEIKEKTIKTGILFKLNDNISFDNLKDLHNYFIEDGFAEIKNTNEKDFTRIEIILEKNNLEFSNKNQSSIQEIFLNFSVYEVGINNLCPLNKICDELANLRNKIILFCVTSLRYDKIKDGIEKIKNYLKFSDNDNLLIVLTKPDRVEEHRDFFVIEKHCHEMNLNFCFVKLRSNQERISFPNVSSYLEVEEKFYQSSSYFKKYHNSDINGFKGISQMLINLVIKYFDKNQKQIKNFIKIQCANKFSQLSELGDEIPNDLKKKKAKLVIEIKSLIKIFINFFEHQTKLIKYFLENIFHGLNNEVFENANEIESHQLIKELTKIFSTNFHKSFYNSSRIYEIIKNESFSKELLIEKINSNFIKIVFEKIMEHIKYVLDSTVKNNNLEEINKEIEKMFPYICDDFKNKIFETFHDLIEDQLIEAFKHIDYNNEMEKNLFYFSKQEYVDEINVFYNEILIKGKINFDSHFEEFFKSFLLKICRDKLKTILETNCKIFSYFFYTKLSNTLGEISIEKIIESLFHSDEELTQYEEEESVTETRYKLKEDLDNLIRVYELLDSLNKGAHMKANLNRSINASSIDYLNKSLMRSTLDMNYKLPLVKNINYYKFIMDKYLFTSTEDSEYENNVCDDFSDKLNFSIEKIRNSEIDFSRKQTRQSEHISEPQRGYEKDEKITDTRIETSFVKFTSNEFAMIWDNTDEITVYNSTTKSINRYVIPEIPYDQFLENNRYINIGKKVFIAGGNKSDGEKTKLFLELNRPMNDIKLLPNSKENFCRNSMIYIRDENSIIFVGGTESKLTYSYDITDKKWGDYGRLQVEREDPSLILLNNSTLICFGGNKMKNEKHCGNLIEYKLLNGDWKNCIFDYNDKYPGVTSLCGSGIIPLTDHKLILVGGYNSENMNDEENVFELSIERDFPLKLNLHKVDENKFKGGNKILSWFPENNFLLNNEQTAYSNFNLEGEIIIFDKENKDFNVIFYDIEN